MEKPTRRFLGMTARYGHLQVAEEREVDEEVAATPPSAVVPDEVPEPVAPSKKRKRVVLDLIEQAQRLLSEDFEDFKRAASLRGHPVTPESYVQGKFNMAINAINSYELEKQRKPRLPVPYGAWKKKQQSTETTD